MVTVVAEETFIAATVEAVAMVAAVVEVARSFVFPSRHKKKLSYRQKIAERYRKNIFGLLLLPEHSNRILNYYLSKNAKYK